MIQHYKKVNLKKIQDEYKMIAELFSLESSTVIYTLIAVHEQEHHGEELIF